MIKCNKAYVAFIRWKKNDKGLPLPLCRKKGQWRFIHLAASSILQKLLRYPE
jgi:hypothetical protein